MKRKLALFLITILIISAVPVMAFASVRLAPEAISLAAEPEETRGTDSSEKEITAVRLLDSNKAVIAEGTLEEMTWTIVLPSDTDQSLINSIGASADVFMQIEYKGASLRQENGYDDAGQESWASGNIICGVSVNSWKIFIVTAENGTIRQYMIAIEYTEPNDDPGEEPGSGTEPGGEEPSQGAYTITATTPKGGTLLFSKMVDGSLSQSISSADAGDSIIVTAVPDSGYRMVDGSLSYTLAVAGGETVKISGNRFTMPNCNVTITCRWEADTSSGEGSGSEAAQEPGITGFMILGVSGVISKNSDTEYTISITLPHGTDVTDLVPGIASYGSVSISPASGKAQDFSSPVTYTVTLEDGTELHYVVTVSVSAGSKADQMWDELIENNTQQPWWEYAEELQSKGKYPKYW